MPYLQHQVISSPFIQLNYDRWQSVVNIQMREEAEVADEEYLYAYRKRCIIEPAFGWALTEEIELIAESFPFAHFVLDQFKPRLTASQYQKKEKCVLPEAVLLWENYTNYFHFLNDFVGRLALLDRLNISRQIPVVVPFQVRISNLFKQFRELCPDFFDRNWCFQQGYLEVSEVTYFVKSTSCIYSNFQPLLNELSHLSAHDDTPERIFITRSAKHGRGVVNALEIEKIAVENGFAIVDTANLTVAEQIRLFNKATHVIGLHGAGLTNMVFCQKKGVRMLEIFPGNFFKAVYYWLAAACAHQYDCLLGEPTQDETLEIGTGATVFKSNFYLSPKAFSVKLAEWIN